MAFFQGKAFKSLFGRQFGLQRLSTVDSGGRLAVDYLVGAESVRVQNSTADTTAANVQAFGHTVLTSAVSSGVYTLDPPVPGVEKVVTFNTTGATIYLKSANSETFTTTQGTSQTTLKSTQNVAFSVRLIPLSTAVWSVIGAGSSAIMAASTST